MMGFSFVHASYSYYIYMVLRTDCVRGCCNVIIWGLLGEAWRSMAKHNSRPSSRSWTTSPALMDNRFGVVSRWEGVCPPQRARANIIGDHSGLLTHSTKRPGSKLMSLGLGERGGHSIVIVNRNGVMKMPFIIIFRTVPGIFIPFVFSFNSQSSRVMPASK